MCVLSIREHIKIHEIYRLQKFVENNKRTFAGLQDFMLPQTKSRKFVEELLILLLKQSFDNIDWCNLSKII